MDIQDAAIKCKQCGSSIDSATSPEIDITPGMINAGVKEFRSFRRDETCTTEIVRAVYSAMHERFLLDQHAEQATKGREQSPLTVVRRNMEAA
jgi:hypothetical protein